MSLLRVVVRYSGLFVIGAVALAVAAAFAASEVPAHRQVTQLSAAASEPAAAGKPVLVAGPASPSAAAPATVLYVVNTQAQADNALLAESEWARLALAPGSTIRPRNVEVVVVDSPRVAAGINAVLNRIMAAHQVDTAAVVIQVVDLRDQ